MAPFLWVDDERVQVNYFNFPKEFFEWMSSKRGWLRKTFCDSKFFTRFLFFSWKWNEDFFFFSFFAFLGVFFLLFSPHSKSHKSGYLRNPSFLPVNYSTAKKKDPQMFENFVWGETFWLKLTERWDKESSVRLESFWFWFLPKQNVWFHCTMYIRPLPFDWSP